MLIFLSSITSGEEEEEEEEEGEVVSGGNGDLDGYHHQPPPARILSTDSISRPAVTAAGTQRPFYSDAGLHLGAGYRSDPAGGRALLEGANTGSCGI
ncbi:hypothetical protein NQZ68_030080 [Dissostichus eleginoides]|nr:hypothetical protein NQZ68_030080 [Dissostichus eleginoides]